MRNMTSDFDLIREALADYDAPGTVGQTSVMDALSRVEAAAEQAEKALVGIVMAEPFEVDGRTMWPSFSGALQNQAAVALAVLPARTRDERGRDQAASEQAEKALDASPTPRFLTDCDPGDESD